MLDSYVDVSILLVVVDHQTFNSNMFSSGLHCRQPSLSAGLDPAAAARAALVASMLDPQKLKEQKAEEQKKLIWGDKANKVTWAELCGHLKTFSFNEFSTGGQGV